MTHELTKLTPLPLSEAVAKRVAGFGSAVKAAIQNWINRRRIMADLAGMDERMLRDIGVTGHDVRSALAAPMWEDPSLVLTRLAAERRDAARACALEALMRRRGQMAEPEPEPEPLRIAC